MRIERKQELHGSGEFFKIPNKNAYENIYTFSFSYNAIMSIYDK